MKQTQIHESELHSPLSKADEVASILNVSRSTIYRLQKQGVIPCVKMGRAVRFDIRDVFEALKKYYYHEDDTSVLDHEQSDTP